MVKQVSKGVAMNLYTSEDSNISETYTSGFQNAAINMTLSRNDNLFDFGQFLRY